MTVPMNVEILKKIPFKELGTVFKMGKRMAAIYLTTRHPELTDEEHQDVLSRVKDDPAPVITEHDPHRQLFLAVAWLCGASLSQLAQMINVRDPTISKYLNKELPVHGRQQLRLAQPPIEPWKLEGLRENYYMLVNADARVFAGKTPLEVAQLIVNLPVTTEPDTEIESAYADLEVKEAQ
jgi:hypothetical protein